MQETRDQSLCWEDPLEKEMATLSSILSWEMPWTEEPGGLQSTGSQRVGHVLATKQQTICVQRTMQILWIRRNRRSSVKIEALHKIFPIAGLPWWLSGKESACNAGDMGLIPGSGRSLGEGNGYPLQYSCLEKSIERGNWWATVHVVAKVGHDWMIGTHAFNYFPLFANLRFLNR